MTKTKLITTVAWIADSDPTQGMDVCQHVSALSCVDRHLIMDYSHPRVLTDVYQIKKKSLKY